MASTVTVGPVTCAAGSKAFGWLEICTMADGAPLHLPVHVIAGSQPGPRVTVIAAQHGYEICEIEVCRRVMEQVDPRSLKGTLVVVPVANPISFEGGVRSTWLDSLYGDNGNMNRVWPGRADGWITDRMVYDLNEQVVKGSDLVVDLHDGDTAPPGLTICYAYAATGDDPQLNRRIREIAIASGIDILVKKRAVERPSTLSGYAIGQGIPCWTCEVGEFYGFQLNGETPPDKPVRTIPEAGVTALLNIMKHLGMLQGELQLPKRQVIISPENNLRPSQGGLLVSQFKGNAIGRVVPKGTLLGSVVSPYSFETVDEIRAPYDQNLIIATTYRRPFAKVNPGNYGYIVSDMANAEWVTH